MDPALKIFIYLATETMDYKHLSHFLKAINELKYKDLNWLLNSLVMYITIICLCF